MSYFLLKKKNEMKNIGLIVLLLIGFACEDDIPHKINGQWQLKTITYPDGNIEYSDSIFYNFQKQAVFAFTHLIDKETSSNSYGYLDFPSENEIKISMDTTRDAYGNFINIIGNFLEISKWNYYEEVFEVKDVNKGRLIFVDSDKKVYTFEKH